MTSIGFGSNLSCGTAMALGTLVRRRESPVTEDARSQLIARCIAAEITKGRYDSQSRLPSVRALAQRWSASKSTIAAALQLLQRQGVVMCEIRQRGFWIAGRDKQTKRKSPTPVRERHHVRIARALRQEILSGEYRTGVISTKELRARFECSSDTARLALEELADLGLVSMKGRSFVYALRGSASKKSTCICFGADPCVFRYPHLISFMSSLERESRLFGFRHLLFYFEASPRRGKPPADETTAAYVHVKAGEVGEWEAFFRSHPKIPLIVIDDAERLTWKQSRFGPHHRFFQITFTNRQAGQQIAAHLLEHGHRHIAFISHVRIGKGWTSRRLQGLQDIFNGVDPSHQVTVCAWRETNPINLSGARDVLAHMSPALPECTTVPANELFQQALKSRATAWVCANDEVAALAHQFLVQRGLCVPGDISLVGFDNSPLSQRTGLTTYDFCYDRAASATLRYVMNPGAVVKDTSGNTRIDGELIARSSVRKLA